MSVESVLQNFYKKKQELKTARNVYLQYKELSNVSIQEVRMRMQLWRQNDDISLIAEKSYDVINKNLQEMLNEETGLLSFHVCLDKCLKDLDHKIILAEKALDSAEKDLKNVYGEFIKKNYSYGSIEDEVVRSAWVWPLFFKFLDSDS